jgi:L-lactate dehydrogenase complex protein LldG
MQRYKHPESTEAKYRILKRIREATAGRSSVLTGIPAGTFISTSDEPLLKQFTGNLENINGHCLTLTDSTQLFTVLNNLAGANHWKQIACADPIMAKRLMIENHTFTLTEAISGDTDAVITGCEALIAATGSVLVSSAHIRGRQAFVFGPAHIVVAYGNQLFPDADSAFESVISAYGQDFPSIMSVISGPSRTADIEKTLILGAHGPKSLHVLFIDKDITE